VTFRLHPEVRGGIAFQAQPHHAYNFTPLACNAAHARRAGVRPFERVQPEAAQFNWEEEGVAFFTTWTNAWQEVANRAVPQVFETWCTMNDKLLNLIPAMWSPTGPASNQLWLSPFSNGAVKSMDFYPGELQQAMFGNRGPIPSVQCDVNGIMIAHRASSDVETHSCLEQYHQASESYFQSRGQLCHASMRVCDFSSEGAGRRLWSMMQAVLAFHVGMPSPGALIPRMRTCEPDAKCPLRVLIFERVRRRRILNLPELVQACSRWRPPLHFGFHDLEVECKTVNFSQGILQHASTLRRADVFISMHGADMVNGLALHSGATIMEILPPRPHPCDTSSFFFAFTNERRHTFFYRAYSDQLSYSSSPVTGGRNADVQVPPALIEALLNRTVQVGGDPDRYKYGCFDYDGTPRRSHGGATRCS